MFAGLGGGVAVGEEATGSGSVKIGLGDALVALEPFKGASEGGDGLFHPRGFFRDFGEDFEDDLRGFADFVTLDITDQPFDVLETCGYLIIGRLQECGESG